MEADLPVKGLRWTERHAMWARTAVGLGVMGAVVVLASNFPAAAQSGTCSPTSGFPGSGSPTSLSPIDCSPTTTSPSTTSPTSPSGPGVPPGTTPSSSSSPAPLRHNTVSVPAGGGLVTLPFGGEVRVPQGAVPPGVTLEITVSSTPSVGLPASTQLAGTVVTLNSTLSIFGKPIMIIFTIPSSAIVNGVSPLRFAVFRDGQWQFVGAHVGQGATQVSASVSQPGSYAVLVHSQQFPDLNAAPWAVADENTLIGTGAISGFPNGDFEPNAVATRAEVAKVITEVYGLQPATETFSDVPADAWYAPYVGAVDRAGIMLGVGNNLFDPNGVVTRAQFATLMARAMKLPGDPRAAQLEFVDGSTAPSWAQGGIGALARVGILRGLPGDLLDPNGQLTRAELAALVVRSLRFQGLVSSATGA